MVLLFHDCLGNHCLLVGGSQKTVFFLISTRGLYIVSALVEKYLLKALPIVTGQLNYKPNGLVSKLF